MKLLGVSFKHELTTDIDLDLGTTKTNRKLKEYNVVVEFEGKIYQRITNRQFDDNSYFTWRIEVDSLHCDGTVLGKRFNSWIPTKLSAVPDKSYLIDEPDKNGQCDVYLIHPDTQKKLEETFQEKIIETIKRLESNG